MAVDIAGIGVSLPGKVLTNTDLEKIVDTTDEWIKTRTGIEERRIVEDGTTVSDLAAEAGLAAIDDADLEPADIDLIIVASGSPEMIWPSTACLAQSKMNMPNCPAFDIQAACTGFVYGLTVADGLITSGVFKNILLVGAEAISRLVDWTDRSTCVLFADGAGAVVLKEAETGFGILASYMNADGSGADLLKIPAGGSAQVCSEAVIKDTLQTIKMSGNEIYRFAMKVLPESVEEVLDRAQLSIDDIDYFIPHQANERITRAAVERLSIPKERVVSNISKYGNTSTASIPLALEEIYRAGSLQVGNIVVMAAFGAGLTWGANVLRWGRPASGGPEQ